MYDSYIVIGQFFFIKVLKGELINLMFDLFEIGIILFSDFDFSIIHWILRNFSWGFWLELYMNIIDSSPNRFNWWVLALIVQKILLLFLSFHFREINLTIIIIDHYFNEYLKQYKNQKSTLVLLSNSHKYKPLPTFTR